MFRVAWVFLVRVDRVVKIEFVKVVKVIRIIKVVLLLEMSCIALSSEFIKWRSVSDQGWV